MRDAWAIAVYPVTFRFEASPYESFARGTAIADQVSRSTNCLVYGPGEFRLIDPDDDDARHGSTVAATVRFSPQHRPEGLFVLRTSVNRTIDQAQAAVVTGAGPGMGRGEMTEDVVVRLELLSVSSRAVVAEVEGKARVNLLGNASEGDPFPDVTRLTAALVERLASVSGLPGNQKSEVAHLHAIPVLFPALSNSSPGATSTAAVLKQFDAIDREARVLSLVHRVDPTASRTRQKLLQLHEAGLVVTDPGNAAALGLQVDDLILSADDEPVMGRYALDRHVASGPTHLRVRRKGEEQEVVIQNAAGR